MRERKGQFNFAWMFAIIIGGTILFLAIFGAMKVGDTARFQSDTEIAKSIAIITDPLQASFAEGSFGKIPFKQETRINNKCLDVGFGQNDISVATQSDIGQEWNLAAGATSIHNKYLFSSKRNSGTDYYVFSKPFKFPYKVADLTFFISENYCFLNAPDKVIDEVEGLKIESIEIDDCTLENSIKVCFGPGGGCDITVSGSCGSNCDSVYDVGTVITSSGDMRYVGSLMYAAIFSDKSVYDCNVKRLMYRNAKIAEVLIEKSDLMDARGCNTNLKGELTVWHGQTINATSDDLAGLRATSNSMNSKNSGESCGMW